MPARVLTVEFRILGTLHVASGERSVEFPRAKPRALLAMLVIHANQVVSADRLLDALWGDLHPASATNTLQAYVSHVRHRLAELAHGEPIIRTQAPGYVLTVDEESIDARRFERLVSEARRALFTGDAEQSAGLFDEALDLWRGPALADFAGDVFASVEAARLEELRLAAIEDQTEAWLAVGRHGHLISRLQALVAEHPFRERLSGQLMVALYRSGRQAEALRVFQRARTVLAEELGIGAGPELRRLEGEILAQAPSLQWAPQARSNGDDTGGRRHILGGGHPTAEKLPFPPILSTVSGFEDYVGRGDVLGRLRQACVDSLEGTPRTVFVAGEPGIGKTRTAAEVARDAFAQGAVVLYGHCDEDVAMPYQPFMEMLDWYTTHSSEPVLGRYPAELMRLQPLLASRVPDLGTPLSSDPRSEEYLLFEASSSWLVELARRQPLVLVLDDLHWASKPVLLLLRHIVRSASTQHDPVPLLVFGTYRDTEVVPDHPLAELLADLHRVPRVTRMVLAGLSPAEVEEFVARAVGQPLDAETTGFAHALYEETEGNPFFLNEMLRHLSETVSLYRGADRRIVIPKDKGAIPESVRDVVARRIGRLSERTRDVLSTAAVFGADFDVELLAALSDLSEDDLLDVLDQSRRARLIEESGPERYRFAHALVRASLVDGLSATRRRRLHRRIAEVFERLRPDDVVALAHHFAEAGPDPRDRARALQYGLAAAEQALEARALADAESRLVAVLSTLVDEADVQATERIRAMCGLGEAQRDQGNPDYRSTLLEAARLAKESGDVALLVRAALSNSRGLPSVIGGIDAQRISVTEWALAAVDGDPSPERALLLAQLASEVSFAGDDRRRLRLADEAEAMARRVGDAGLLSRVLNRTGYASYSSRRIDRLVARAEEATRLSDATGDPAQRVLARYFLSGALLTAGDMPAFRRVTESMPAIAERAAPTFQWLALVTQARLSVLAGDSEGAQRINDDAFLLAQRLGEPDGPAWWGAILCPLEFFRGGFGSMVDLLKAGVDQYPEERAWSIGYALSLVAAGRSTEARAALDREVPAPEDLLEHPFPFFNIEMLAYLAFHLDDAVLAGRVAAAMEGYSGCWSHQYAATIGPVRIGLALCAAATGDIDHAISLCEAVEQTLVDLHCVGLLPHFRTYYVEILRRRGTDRDRARACELLDEVRRGAKDMNAPQLATLAEELSASCNSSPSVSTG